MTLKKSIPRIIGNKLQDNDGIGLFLKDKFFGTVKENKVIIVISQIFDNEIDLAVEKFIKNIN